jgi:hypothetical protein
MRTVFLFVLLYTFSISQTTPEASKVPLHFMSKLKDMSGKWKLTMKTTTDGKTWTQVSSIEVNVKPRLKGLMLAEVPVVFDEKGFNLETFITYDQYRNVYRKSVIDDTWGIMDIYEGQIENGKLVLTNLNSKTFFPLGNGVWRGFRLTIDISGDTREMHIDKTDDYGKTWQPNFVSVYRKIKE